MNPLPILILTLLMLAACNDDYVTIDRKDLQRSFIVNSSPTFLGYYYEGSDDGFHYFSSRWKYQRDRKFKVARTALEISREVQLGSGEIALTVIQSGVADPVFCEIEGRPVYERRLKE